MRRFAMRVGAFSVALILGSGLAVGTAAADEPTSTEPAPPTTTTTTEPPPPSETPPPSESTPPPPTSTEPAPPPPSSTVPEPTTTTPTPPTDPTGTPAPPASASSSSSSPAPAKGGLADLAISATFAKPTYQASDKATVLVTIRNAGSVAAEGVRASGGGNLDVWGAWGALGAKPGVRIEPHATRTAELTGRILNANNGKITFSAKVSADTSDANPADNGTFVEVPLQAATGAFAGRIFGDQNANGAVDGSETGLAGIHVNISGGVPFGNYEATTDTQGRFDFGEIPTGEYFVNWGDNAPGWNVYGFTGNRDEKIVIDDSGKYANVSIPATRHLQESMHVSMTFDQGTYQPADTTHLTVVLSNFSDHDLAGITAICNRFGSPAGLRGGPGWGTLAEGGPGVTVPAKTTKTFQVSEAVPAASPDFGYVTAFCVFPATGYPVGAGAQAEASASVPGTKVAQGAGRIFHDTNANNFFEDGVDELVRGAPVVITDPSTGAVVAQPTTDNDGKFAVANLPAGIYDLRVVGPWKAQFQDGWFRFAVFVTDSPFTIDYGVVPDSEQNNNRPNLKATAVFDKPAYKSGEDVHVRVTITNIGTVAAEEVHAQQDFIGGAPGLFIPFDAWGDLDTRGPGVRIEAGATRTVDITGSILFPDAGSVSFGARVAGKNGDINADNNRFTIVAPVALTKGNVTGVVTGRDADGSLVKLRGVHVIMDGRAFNNRQTTDTDERGEFSLKNIPTDHYRVTFILDDWVIPVIQDLVVDETDDPPLEVRAERPLLERLHVTVAFQEDGYHVGDTAHVKVVLTNDGKLAAEHVRAFCLGVLSGSGEGWGDLRPTTGGVTVAAGETKTINVTDVVPDLAGELGFVDAGCLFGPDLDFSNPFAFDTATIIGAKGTAHGRLVRDVQGDGRFDDPVADTKVVLINPRTGQPVAKGVTKADGNFDIPDLPARHYEVRVVGPWKFTNPGEQSIFVSSGVDLDRFVYELEPGPEQPDPFPDGPATPDPPPPAEPQPQAAAAPAGLASTGASVVGLSVASLALLLIGFGVVAASRRRRPN